MQIITHRKHAVNLTRGERIASAVGGGLLAAVGLGRRSAGGFALALVGGDLLRRAITGHSYAYEAMGIRTVPVGQGAETTSVPYELGVRVDESIAIDRPRQEVYRFWRSLSNLPRFMKNLESVSEFGNRSHWVARGMRGRRVEWDAVIHNEREGELLAWRSLPGADFDHAGSVLFDNAPGGGTIVRIELQYNPPGGALGAIFASLWGSEPGQQLHQDLQRLKTLLESGAAANGADRVDEASEESFPASDAPSYNPSAL
jgi:uncharacterized membrane protein